MGLLERVFAQIAAAEPDVLVLGGDYVFLNARERELRALERLTREVSCACKLGVLGNHDLWSDDAAIRQALEAGGVEVMVNESRSLPAPFADVRIAGVDDPWAGEPDADRALQGADSAVSLVLCHSPEGLPLFAGRDVSLVLCGHTHGGQIDLPRGRPWAYTEPLGRQFLAGHYRFEDKHVIVSRGVGAVCLPVRIGADPEWCSLTLTEREQ